ncbi:ATP-grasp domain-containing protein [Urbifossiella limnaea]|uniref:ATP-grasp domain-containing protein n=1 Tax=Urbifossiella limnaea TaxID=2528023 RepID=A0A517XLY2_9BACT|nr:ATP-grasp domain-containing protein [Urbifossiella limnaea]QDU18509.1 hypothetical protein ETAA1_03990 [Urbifossiella limnaea]
MHFLFPQDPRGRNFPEDIFEEQAAALAAAGFTYSLLRSGVLRRGQPLDGVPPGADVVYRGWMLTAVEYGRLSAAVEDAGARLFTTPGEYLAAHHLPNWYPLITDLTPETRVYPADADLARELATLSWDGFFVKDYVKSLKTSVGSLVRDPAGVERVVAEMREYRGEIEGGVCVRRVEDFLVETERRYFVIRGRAYASDPHAPIPGAVATCAGRVPSPFFSVDIVRRADGVDRVVEVGDGQVSDLVGWSADTFAAMWRTAIVGPAGDGA